MKKRFFKKAISLLISSTVILGSGICVFADEQEEEIPEDVRPMKPSVVDDLFALLKALSDVVCHSFTYFLCKDMMF